jgi:hypothetical protein
MATTSKKKQLEKKMTPEKAQGVALRCVRAVGNQKPQVNDVLNTVGIPDPMAVQGLTREIVHGDEGVRKDGYTMRTADFSSISPASTVQDVADVIRRKAAPRKRKAAE